MGDIKWYEPLWGSWYVDRLIGEGAFGKVYRVKKVDFGKAYYSAVKIITIPQTEADLRQILSEGMDETSARGYIQTFVADIIQEIDLMSVFRGNSNFVSLEDHKIIERTGEIGWDILIRMELLNSLSSYTAGKTLNFDEVIRLGIHICQALELCTLRNIIHRDVKPDNIFVSEYGDYKLGDFGIARQIERTMGGLSKKGTYAYMAPEVFRGYEYGADVDMYSLAIVMYCYLNYNRMPFLPEFPYPITLSNRDMALQRRMRGEPLPPIKGINSSLNAILQKACAYDRKARFSSPTEMREALETVVGKGNLVQKAASIQPVENKLAASKTNYYNPMETTANIFGLAASGERAYDRDTYEVTEIVAAPFPHRSAIGNERKTIWEKPQTASRRKRESYAQMEAEKPFLGKLQKVIAISSVIILAGIFLFVITQIQSGSTDDVLLPYQVNSHHNDIMQVPRTEAIRVVVNLNNANISDSDLVDKIANGEIPAGTTELNLFDNTISDLAPLQSLTFLKELDIGENQISDITPLQTLTNLTNLYMSGNQINDITPLQPLIALETLSLRNNQISDITSLQSLANLTWLNLGNNQINDLTPLQSLTELTDLGLRLNQINDITPLQSLTNLAWLGIGENQISDLTPLQSLTFLKELDIEENQISDITHLQSLTNLTNLFMSGNQISDIRPLQSLTFLKELGIDENQISDITPLQSLTNLTNLYISGNQISDITPLQSLVNLTWLVLENNQISDLAPLQSLTELTALGLKINQINDITPLQSLSNLTRLAIAENQISDLTPLQSLTKLTNLCISYNQISDITPLQSLLTLEELQLMNNQIIDITPLQSLVNLTELAIEKNRIIDITPLQSLTNLTWLGIGENQISDITPLQSLANLTWLDLDNNQISDLTPLESLTKLTALGLLLNQIDDITPLQSLTDLMWLAIGENQISDITPLQSLTNLTSLCVGSNQVSDLTPLQSLTELMSLYLRQNQISDITPLQSLTNLMVLDIENNQISDIIMLHSMVILEELYLGGNQLSQSQVDELQQLLPNCTIHR